jgi:hypothetical protein
MFTGEEDAAVMGAIVPLPLKSPRYFKFYSIERLLEKRHKPFLLDAPKARG